MLFNISYEPFQWRIFKFCIFTLWQEKEKQKKD